ncbi:MAG: hypothetical protein KDI13_06795 [Alphaproteobacteria bacterium]|nr:hypothetical protein [Alphaproteobacteria bacterium]
MKFVFFGYDYSLEIAKALIADGHTLIRLFTFPCDSMFNFNTQLKNLAQNLNIPVTETPITPQDIENALKDGCTLFLAAGYPHKIPPIDEKQAYALNIHPSLLPKARGIMPLPYIIQQTPEAAGFTIHKISDKFDNGDIIYQEPLPVSAETDIEILSAQIAMRTPGVTVEIVRDISNLWHQAKPQDPAQATHVPPPDEAMRSLDWTQTIESLNQKGRAFGRFGVIATLQNRNFVVFNFKGWQEAHSNTPGDVLLAGPREIIVAAKDGYICLKEFHALEAAP